MRLLERQDVVAFLRSPEPPQAHAIYTKIHIRIGIEPRNLHCELFHAQIGHSFVSAEKRKRERVSDV